MGIRQPRRGDTAGQIASHDFGGRAVVKLFEYMS